MSKFYYNQEQESYDAIVVGTGISGGWAAKELCENGLKTLVLERGPMVTVKIIQPKIWTRGTFLMQGKQPEKT